MNFITGFKIRSEITSKLNFGANKQEIYNSLVEDHGLQPIFERILSDIPISSTKEKYKILIKFLLLFLSIVAVVKGYFLILGIIKYSGIPNITLVTTLFPQFMMIWMVLKISRTGVLATAVVTGMYFFDYQKGLYHEDFTIKLSCLVIMTSSIFIIAIASFLYFKMKENWKIT